MLRRNIVGITGETVSTFGREGSLQGWRRFVMSSQDGGNVSFLHGGGQREGVHRENPLEKKQQNWSEIKKKSFVETTTDDVQKVAGRGKRLRCLR